MTGPFPIKKTGSAFALPVFVLAMPDLVVVTVAAIAKNAALAVTGAHGIRRGVVSERRATAEESVDRNYRAATGAHVNASVRIVGGLGLGAGHIVRYAGFRAAGCTEQDKRKYEYEFFHNFLH
jgi:hypothetical protein